MLKDWYHPNEALADEHTRQAVYRILRMLGLASLGVLCLVAISAGCGCTSQPDSRTPERARTGAPGSIVARVTQQVVWSWPALSQDVSDASAYRTRWVPYCSAFALVRGPSVKLVTAAHCLERHKVIDRAKQTR